MDTEKSSNSSFEDLSTLNETEVPAASNKSNVQVSKSDAEMNAEIRSAAQDLLQSIGNIRTDIENCGVSQPEKSSDGEPKRSNDDISAPDESQERSGVPGSEMLSGHAEEKASEESGDSLKTGDDEVCDILGNNQLVKRVIIKSLVSKRTAKGDLVTITYIGKLDDGTEVEEGTNLQLHVGDYEVVQGLDMAIPLMNIGEVSEIIVDPRFAYGTIGLKNDKNPEKSIPPNARIRYEVQLIDSKYEEYADLKKFEIRKKYGNLKKERANFWYNRNEFNIAIMLYKRALEYLDDRDGDPDAGFDNDDLQYTNSELQSLLEDRLVVYNNLAMAQIKISALDAALKSVDTVLLCQPNNSKALYRKGRILEGKGDTKMAIKLLQKAATLEPDSKVIQQDLAKLFIKARREEHNEKEMYQKMLGQAKKLEQKNKQPQKQQNVDSSKLKLLGYIMGSILIGVAGVAIYRYKY